MQISQQGINFIKSFEGCKLETYPCPRGVLTIGYGHTGKDVTKGLKITQEKADELFKEDISKFSHNVSFALDTNEIKVNQHEFDMLVSLAYNIGYGAWLHSSLFDYLEKGDKLRAGNEFLKWNKVNKKPNMGLTRRRNAEYEIFRLGYM